MISHMKQLLSEYLNFIVLAFPGQKKKFTFLDQSVSLSMICIQRINFIMKLLHTQARKAFLDDFTYVCTRTREKVT